MVCVFPGCPEVLAKDFLFTRALMRDDFPTFDLPANATSGNVYIFYNHVFPPFSNFLNHGSIYISVNLNHKF